MAIHSSILAWTTHGQRSLVGAAGAAEAGVVLVAAEPGLQDQVTVGQLRLVDTVPAGVPGLGGQHCETPGQGAGERGW